MEFEKFTASDLLLVKILLVKVILLQGRLHPEYVVTIHTHDRDVSVFGNFQDAD